MSIIPYSLFAKYFFFYLTCAPHFLLASWNHSTAEAKGSD